MKAEGQKQAVAWLSVGSNTTLVAFKLIVGLFIGSVSVISEAIHSAIDLLAAIIALVAVRGADKPADPEHPYGHGKLENLSGTIEAALIFIAAVWIAYEAVHKLIAGLHGDRPEMEAGWGIVAMAVSVVANIIVSRVLFRVGKATDSVALQADAWHLLTDVWTSLGVFAALGVYVGVRAKFGVSLWWLDPVAALGVAALITKAAWDLTLQAARDLMDASLPPDEEAWIRQRIRQEPCVRGCHHLRTRKAGAYRFVEFHLQLDPGMSVAESHDIVEAIEQDIEARYARTTVTAHIEPCDFSCKQTCADGCFLAPEERVANAG